MKTNEQLALELAVNNGALLRRLKDARSVLTPEFKVFFRRPIFDYENRCLIGTDGYKLQWRTRLEPRLPESYENQQTNVGTVVLVHIQENEEEFV